LPYSEGAPIPWAEFDQRLAEVAARIEAGETLEAIDQDALATHWEFDLAPPKEEDVIEALKRRKEMKKARCRREPRDEGQRRVEAFVRRLMIKSRLPTLTPKKPWGDRWLTHPLPSLSEPKKMVAHLTDQGHLQEDQRAHLYDRASLHGIDQFFMQLRRRLNMAERSLNTATSGREFHIYQPYNPNVLAKLIEVLRVYYNYTLPGADKRTPAMRLGLTDRRVTVDEILRFQALPKRC
jgi:hypothetical protein